jgi:hypothetical protein
LSAQYRIEVIVILTIQSTIFVAGITGRHIADFLLNCTDEHYRRWWPERICSSSPWPEATIMSATSSSWMSTSASGACE